MQKPKLHKLSSLVINQIAAGEVVERPSSVVKELVDNAIDANATKIHIKVKNGGMDLVEVSDNGIGIPKENMPLVFDSHTTSKIKDIDDLNTLLSMGFRGEALSTITSVSIVTLTSKYENEDFGNEVKFDSNGVSKVRKYAKEQGTTVKVENIFYNIPARRKYLKTPQTEYRKIYELLLPYFIIYPNIHFVLEKEDKVVEELLGVKDSKPGDLTKERVGKILKDENTLLRVHYSGAGIDIDGYVAHPSKHKSKLSKSYIFVNNRPIFDKGIVRAVYEGYSRYLPSGQRVDFVLNIKIDPEFVDVNVHPRKEEVRFENPYRVYTAIEEAIKHTLNKELSFQSTPSSNVEASKDFSSLRDRFNSSSQSSKDYQASNVYISNKSASVKDTLLFSKELLRDSPVEDFSQLPLDDESNIVNIFQIFNKYIIVEFSNDQIWIIDQHAAAERVNFEKLSKGRKNIDVQNYLVPIEIQLNEEHILLLREQKEFFESIGISFDIKDKKVSLKTVPVEFAQSDFKNIFEEIFALEEDISLLKRNFKRLKEDILATISCHSSIRSGQKLNRETMLDLFTSLSKCENPYSCPHGRPAVWKLTLREIDNNFERTY